MGSCLQQGCSTIAHKPDLASGVVIQSVGFPMSLWGALQAGALCTTLGVQTGLGPDHSTQGQMEMAQGSQNVGAK